ncbi:hypothetical protein ACOMHN_020541 [Nucella lapillus]
MVQCCKRCAPLLLIVLVATWSEVAVGIRVNSCLPPNAASPGSDPPEPRITNSFRVKVESTEEGDNSTKEMEMIVDGSGNRAVLVTMKDGRQTTDYFFYGTQEIISISDTNCTVRNMSADPERFVFFGETMRDGRGHIPDGASALCFGPDIVKVYKGRGYIVRGIECEMWQTCITAPQDPHLNLTIAYYFSVKSWTTPSLYSRVPIRYDVSGRKLLDNGTVTSVHTLHDFFDFLPDTDADSTVFEIPEGVVCPGRTSTQAMPELDLRYFHFQEEMIDVRQNIITQAEIWYDLDHKLIRVDYRSPSPDPPLKTTDPVSVIHDYTYGVSYVKDLVSGQCSPMALAPNGFDTRVNEAAYLKNGSFVMTMKQPRAFFFLDSNFTYSGQRYSRNALCDVYISHRYDFDYFNNGSGLEATVEIFFLAVGWLDFSKDSGGRVSQQFPVRIEIWIPKVNRNVIYNIFGFDPERPDISVFDVTDCYDDSVSIDFRVRFLGPYHRDREHEVRVVSQDTLTQTMGVSPLRVNNVQLQYDASYLYLSATLLDRTPSLAQFTHLPKAVPEKTDDFSFGKTESAGACSLLCVSNSVISCQSFQYCPDERGGTCRISRHPVSDGAPAVVAGNTCDLYSRTVTVTGPPELTASQAFFKLKDAIKSKSLYFEIVQDNEDGVIYGAVEVEMLFGRLEDVKLRGLTGQFSYRVETVFPRQHLADVYDVWYDSVSKLVRLDRRDVGAGAPFYSPFTITTIHDYNTGISYSVDSNRGNCTVGRIPFNGTFDGQAVNLTQATTSAGVYALGMKTPLTLFHLDGTYTFTGQKTVRGILCDVFESKRTDFTLGSGTQHSVFQYYFQSGRWQYVADTHDDITMQQPVQLVISDVQANEFIIYNFYDFDDEHITYDNFDIAPCFTDEQRIDFILDFNQTYRPFLDGQEWLFKQEAQRTLHTELRVSPVRLQDLRLSYNLDRTYLTATLLGQVDSQLHFAEAGRSSPYSARVVTPDQTVGGCAASCYYSQDLLCDSFDLCPGGLGCYLSTLHVPDANVTAAQRNVSCRHFSRVTEAVTAGPSVDQAYDALKDLVYKGLIVITITPQNGAQPVVFPAIGVRNDFYSLNPPTETGAEDLHSKFSLYQTGSTLGDNSDSQSGLAVDECAALCWKRDSYTCRAFSYCYSTGRCLLNANRPANNPDIVAKAPLCDLYTRLYLDDYQRYEGQVMESVADVTVASGTEEDCARRCSAAASLPCRSFDFCPSTRHCLLHVLHVSDYGTNTSAISFCSHFSRNYLADFNLNARKEIAAGVGPSVVMMVIDGVGPATCAAHCVAQVQCHSFQFCDSQCRLSSLLPTPSLISDSSNCDLYTLKANASKADRGGSGTDPSVKGTTTGTPGKTTSPQGSTSKPTLSSSTTSPGGVRVGIGVGMLVLGVVLGAVVVLLVQKLTGRRQDDTSLELVPRMS